MTVPVPNTYLSLFPLASLRPSLNAGDFVVPFLSRSDPSKARRRRLQPELQLNYPKLHKDGQVRGHLRGDRPFVALSSRPLGHTRFD